MFIEFDGAFLGATLVLGADTVSDLLVFSKEFVTLEWG